MRIRFHVLAVTLALLACVAMPAVTLAGTLVVDNPTKTDAWITIQNSSKTSNLAAFRVAAGHVYDWVAPQTSPYGNDTYGYVRFQFMSGHAVVCDTRAAFTVQARGATRVLGYIEPGHCHIKTK